jgi:formate C-acetyltransferase
MSARTQTLKDRVVIKTHKVVARGLQEETGGEKPFREGMNVKLCLERAKLITEAYRQTEHEPMVIRRAKALAHILENMTIFIQPDELIVGNFASRPECVAHYPELQWRWLEKAICTPDGPYKELLSESEKEEMKELHKYWKTRAVHGMERELLPDSLKKFFYYKGVAFWTYHWERGTPDYEKVFRLGFEGIIEEINDKLLDTGEKYEKMLIDSRKYLEMKRDLEAMKIALNGVVKWAKRYSALASEMAQNEKDQERKMNLREIAGICGRVPEKPARTLHEALQCFWFIHLIVNYIEEPQTGCGARFDKIFNPFYQKDLAEGRIAKGDARELLECVWLKFLETGFLHPPIWSGMGGGGLGWQTVTIGGTTADGQDITNDLTHLVLDSIKALNTLQPPLALRVHEKTPRELLVKATEVLNTGVAQPAFFNDKVNVPRLTNLGVPLGEARDYGIMGCMWPTIPGKNIVNRASNTGPLFVAKCLELALNRGRDMRTGEQLGPETKDPLEFASVDEIMNAVLEHVGYAARGLFYVGNIANWLYEEYLQRPFLSALLDGCIERGEELRKWTYMPYNCCMVIGVNNVADSLAAIKKLVFDEKKTTMDELLNALKKNWEGCEELRQMCLDAPKFGNDDDYVDSLASDLFIKVNEEVGKVKSYFSNTWTPAVVDGSAASAPYGYSLDTAATPDGRRAGDPFHDGSISPMMGKDRKGPTAALLSVSKIDPLKTWNHLFNQTFMPQYLKDEFVERFADYLKTWVDLGAHHIQFSVVAKETLLDAQKNPVEYPELIVRVCGYAAYFIDLSRGLQNAVIERTHQCF